MPLSAGSKLGPYEILARIGEGGMGEVYRAHDPRLRRDVAIKVSAERFSEHFEKEARAIASLNHPNICTLHDVGPAYLVMELVEGQTLADRIQQDAIPLDEVLAIARQIAEALEAAHERGITHRDLKPGNIIIKPGGVVKVLDFGLAKIGVAPAAQSDNSPTLTMGVTQAGVILGTAAYMAPEQARGIAADRRVDIWAFGVVLYEMLTGRSPFRGETISDTLASVLKTDPDWGALPPHTPAPVRRLLRRCLERDRKRRLRDIGDAFAELEQGQPEFQEPLAPPPLKPERRWWIAAAVLVLVAAGGWAVALFRNLPASQPVLRLNIDPPEGGQFVFGLGFTPGGISVSPDGRTAAYVAVGKGKAGLWVHQMDSGTARLLGGTEDASYPFWSPDGKSLAFFAGGKLQRIDLAGGTPVKICDLETSGIAGAAWSSDGSILIGSLGGPGILRVSAAGGTASPLANQQGSYPQMLPDGRFLYFAVDKPQGRGVYAASLAKPAESTRLLTTDTNALYVTAGDRNSYLLFLRGTTLLAQKFDPGALQLIGEPHALADPVGSVFAIGRMNVAASVTGLLLYGGSNTISQFKWLDRAGRMMGSVGEPGDFPAFRMSPDGRQASLVRAMPEGGSIWLLDTLRGVSTRFTSHPSSDAYPVWSPDGQAIVFSSSLSSSPSTLFVKRLSGTGKEAPLTQSANAFHLATDWSRDGRFVLYFDIGRGTQEDIWYLRVPPEGRLADPAELKPYLRTRSRESQGRFSPEADSGLGPRWVAYQSDESGRFEVYVDSFPEPRRKIRISVDGGVFPEWGPLSGKGARELYYVSPDYKLMMVEIKVGTDSVEPSAPSQLFSLPAAVTTWTPYQVTADGQRFLVRATPDSEPPQPLTMIVNWPSLMKENRTGR